MFPVDYLSEFWGTLGKPTYTNDLCDRLYFQLMPQLLTFFALIIFAKQYAGSPIQCWSNAEFTTSYEEYTNDYCFSQGTYYINVESIPEPTSDRYKNDYTTNYYPYVEFVCFLMAVSLYFPQFLWSLIHTRIGLSVHLINGTAYGEVHSLGSVSVFTRSKLASMMYNSLHIMHKETTTKHMRFFVKFYQKYVRPRLLVLCYFTLKVGFLLVAILQLKVVVHLVRTDLNMFDFYSVVIAIVMGKSWKETGNFPRIGFCDFEIRGYEKTVQKYTVQCVLSASCLNEKIFILIWISLMALIALGVANLAYWTCILLYSNNSFAFLLESIMDGNKKNLCSVFDEVQQKRAEFKRLIKDADSQIKLENIERCRLKLQPKSFQLLQYKLNRRMHSQIAEIRQQFTIFDCDYVVYQHFANFVGPNTVLVFRLMEISVGRRTVNEILSHLFFIFATKFGYNGTTSDANAQQAESRQEVSTNSELQNSTNSANLPKFVGIQGGSMNI